MFQADVFVDSVSAVSLRRLGHKAYFYRGTGGQAEISGHKKVISVSGILEAKLIADPAHAEPDFYNKKESLIK